MIAGILFPLSLKIEDDIYPRDNLNRANRFFKEKIGRTKKEERRGKLWREIWLG
jgi:hypothetical protein